MKLLKSLLVLLTAAGAFGLDRVPVGITKSHITIEALTVPAASGALPKVVLIGALDDAEESAKFVKQEMYRYEASPKMRARFNLIAIPRPNPARAKLAFPPAGLAYRENTEAHYLWRWLGVEAPDLVLIAGSDAGLAQALSSSGVAGIGRIPARVVEARAGALNSLKSIAKSPAREEIARRLARTPRQVAEQLARVYGHELNEVVYIPAIALLGRIRLGDLADVRNIVAHYVDGAKDSLANLTSSHLAGHLLFAELAERTGDARYKDRVLAAAAMAFTSSGEMKDAMPLHNEMSDAVFMGCPILVKAGKLAGERRYFDMADRHLRFMQKLDLRPDGLYRHSPLDEAAWGRGNAFPALGLALALSDFPQNHPAYETMLLSFQSHMAALARWQDETGMWHQVIDMPGSYREFTATAMIATAIQRGIQRGWLDAKAYQPRVNRAWSALLARISNDGVLIDVCESTGKQKSLDDYLNRAAILDRDSRGGAMALLIATELLAAERPQ